MEPSHDEAPPIDLAHDARSPSERRGATRVACVEDVHCDYAFQFVDGTQLFAELYEGHALDLSAEGARIRGGVPAREVDRSRLLESDVEMTCFLLTHELVHEEPVEVVGSVRWITVDENADPSGAGVTGEIGVHWKPVRRWDASCLREVLRKQERVLEAQQSQGVVTAEEAHEG